MSATACGGAARLGAAPGASGDSRRCRGGWCGSRCRRYASPCACARRSAASLSAMISRPDVLVLGGGGVLGEAWIMGVLAGIEDGTGFDLRQCESFVGTSAGAIVAAHLVAGNRPRRPQSTGTELERTAAQPANTLGAVAVQAAKRAGSWALAASSSFAPLALGLSAPGGAV